MTAPADTSVRARIDSATKRQASKALEKMGLSMSDAIRLLLIRVAEEQKMPFEITVPNAVTKEAIDELESGKGKRFTTITDLLDDLNADD